MALRCSRRWYRLHPISWLAGLIVTACFAVVALPPSLSSFYHGEPVDIFEHGWPLVHLVQMRGGVFETDESRTKTYQNALFRRTNWDAYYCNLGLLFASRGIRTLKGVPRSHWVERNWKTTVELWRPPKTNWHQWLVAGLLINLACFGIALVMSVFAAEWLQRRKSHWYQVTLLEISLATGLILGVGGWLYLKYESPRKTQKQAQALFGEGVEVYSMGKYDNKGLFFERIGNNAFPKSMFEEPYNLTITAGEDAELSDFSKIKRYNNLTAKHSSLCLQVRKYDQLQFLLDIEANHITQLSITPYIESSRTGHHHKVNSIAIRQIVNVFPKLEGLGLDHICFDETVPPRMEAMKSFVLHHDNKLEGAHFWLKQMPNLKEFYCGDWTNINLLAALPSTLEDLTIQIPQEQLSSLTWSGLSRLKSLDVLVLRIHLRDSAELNTATWPMFESLQDLDLAFNQSNANVQSQLVEWLSRQPNLKRLEVWQFDEQGSETWPAFLESLRKLDVEVAGRKTFDSP